MRAALIALLLLSVATPALAQTATPSPSPTGASGAAATLNALPTFSLEGSATATYAPTVAWPTLTPNPNMTPRAWTGIGPNAVTPGGPFDPPDPPTFDQPDLPGDETANGFQSINNPNLGAFMVYIVDVAISFYQWIKANLPTLISSARWFVIIMLVLYGIYFIWKGSRYAPPNAERDENPRGWFVRTFRMGGRYYANTRRRSRKG